jgi:transcriptional regulator with XRE-family HTH domain
MNRPGRTAIRRPGAGVTLDYDTEGKAFRLIRLRETRLLSRAQLAVRMSDADPDADGAFTITPDAIAKIENGHRRPKTTTLSRLCEALGCDPEELLPSRADPERVPCKHCSGLFGHEPGCPDAT